MSTPTKLTGLVKEIQHTIQNHFKEERFWITAEIAEVKKHTDHRCCFFKFIEKDEITTTAEIKGVVWAQTFHNIENFEKVTGQTFANGIKVTCNVQVIFHACFGFSLEVLSIDFPLNATTSLAKSCVIRPARLN